MTSVCPTLLVRTADEAADYYRQVFGAEAGPRHAGGDTVLHALITIFGTLVTLKDADETDLGPETLGKAGVIMEITTDDPDTVADRAVQAGGTVVFPVADQPYGARAGRVRDPFGHEWIVSTSIGSRLLGEALLPRDRADPCTSTSRRTADADGRTGC